MQLIRIAFSVCVFFAVLNQLHAQTASSAALYCGKADDFKKNMQPDSALVYYKKAGIESGNFGEHELFVHAYTQVGVILTRQDKYDEARIYLDSALSVGLHQLDSNNLLIATTYISLGVVCAAEENYEQSLIYHNRSLAIRLRVLGENSSEVATSYGNIGNVYLRSKEFDKSIDAHRRAMKIRSVVFGDSSVQIIDSYVGLGNAFREQKEYDSSLVYFQKALSNKVLQRGEGHKDLKRHYNNISAVYMLMGNRVEGELYKSKADSCLKE